MVLFMILLMILLTILTVVVVGIGAIGAAGIIVFGDLIVCIVLMVLLMKAIFFRKKSSRLYKRFGFVLSVQSRFCLKH
jgi:hypothetical protein